MNKKLIKIITCLACGMGIVSTIPFTSASCGCSNEKALPIDVYNITKNDDGTETLNGFTDDFLKNPSNYDSCNTMRIPQNITNIVKDAFRDTNFESVIPTYIKNFYCNDQLLEIGYRAFMEAPFVNVHLNKKILNADGAFGWCASLKNIFFENGIKEISSEMFLFCTSLKSISLPNSITTIGPGAFKACNSLNSIFFHSNIMTIDSRAFYLCESLSKITWDFAVDFSQMQIGDATFQLIPNKGCQISCINKKHSSQELLDWLQGKGEYSIVQGDFPTTGWIAID